MISFKQSQNEKLLFNAERNVIIFVQIEIAEPYRLCTTTSLVQRLNIRLCSSTISHNSLIFVPEITFFGNFVPFLQSTARIGQSLNDVASCASSDFVHSSIVYYREYMEWEDPNVWLQHVFLHYYDLQTDFHIFYIQTQRI